MTQRSRTAAAIAIVALCLALVLGGQALADAVAPTAPNGLLTGEAMGRAGFAYLTGLRQFAAALLWNRLDPQMHEYYGGVGLGRMTFMLPSVKAITILDPHLVEAYYVAPQILIDSGADPSTPTLEYLRRVRAALELAREGVDNNPKSGVLLVSYAQLVWTQGKDLQTATRIAKSAMSSDVVWRWDDEKWDGMAILKAIFTKAGEKDLAARAQAVKDAIDANPNATTQPQDTGD